MIRNLKLKEICIMFFFFMFIACENPFVSSLLPEKGKNSDDRYEYTVTFNKNDGSSVPYAAIAVKSPQKTIIELPQKPERENYYFKEWNTDRGGNGKVFNEKTEVTGDLTVFAKWVNDELTGTASISGVYRIDGILSVNIDDIKGAEPPFKYQWKADDEDISGAGGESHKITGADAGKIISCVVTHDKAAGEITVIGEAVPFDIKVIVSGNTENDSVEVDPDYGKAGDTITVNYFLSDTRKNNIIDFFGVDLNSVSVTGNGSISYIVIADDASDDGVITINAIFTHTDLDIDHISFADNHNETVTYGDTAFTKAITNTGSGTGSITYESSDTTVAAVNNSGVVTIFKIGNTIITAVKAADANYAEARAAYTMTVQQRQLVISDPSVTTAKPYDGTNTAAVTAGELLNKVAGDIVNVTVEASYASVNTGTGILITVVYSISGEDSANYIKPADYTTTGDISSSEGSAISIVPSQASKTQTSITVNPATLATETGQTIEYGISTSASLQPSSWQTTLVFSGLNPGTDYYVWARSKANDDYPQGAAKSSAAIRTNAAESAGAVVSGIYRNIFLERGRSQSQIDAKVQTSWNRLFNDASETYRVYYETAGGDMAFILDTGNNDVRSEGMSYGMMMAVQMNDQAKFDKLWKWSRTYMYNVTNAGKNSRGYFAWQVSGSSPYNKMDVGPAPDGEFYFATALLFAHARWGSTETGDQVANSSISGTTAMFNYRKHAMMLLYDMIHRDTAKGDNYSEPSMIRRNAPGQYMPVFQPQGSAGNFTDPSYHLPSFYQVWAYEMELDANAGITHGVWSNVAAMREDIAFYKNVVTTSRNFFDMALHPVTGLSADYTNFDGTPTGNQNYFGYDAFRTIQNIAMDYSWWAADPRQIEYADRLQAFFHGQGVTSYKALWYIDGTPRNDAGSHSPGLVACNAVASLAASHQRKWDFVDDFWNINMTSGQYRYYDGCLYMFGILHLSGNFKAYLSSGVYANDSEINPVNASFDKRPSQQKDIDVNMTLNGNSFAGIQNGQNVLTQGTDFSQSGDTITLLKSYLSTLPNGNTTLVFKFSAGIDKNLNIAVTTSAAQNSAITPLSAAFAKHAPADISVTMTLNGNTLSGIRNGGTTLTQGSHYTLSGNIVTILTSYLNGLTGVQSLTFSFSEGNNAVLTVTIQDYPASEINPAAAAFYKDSSAGIEVAMTLKGNTLTSIQNNGVPLALNTHYTRNGDTVTILASYLASLSVKQVTLTFVFNQGGNKQLVIDIEDTNPARILKIDFESAISGIAALGANNSVRIDTDPAASGENSLRITTTGTNNLYNRAAIVPVTLPQEIKNYKSVSFRFYLRSGTLGGNGIMIFANTSSSFNANQFGNIQDNEWFSAFFAERFVAQSGSNSSAASGVWIEYTLPINLPASITINNNAQNLGSLSQDFKGNIFLAIGINNDLPLDYYIDDITFALKDDFLIPAAINPATAVFYKAAGEQEDIHVTMTLNGHTLAGIQNSGVPLVSGAHYTVNGNDVTILKSYLAGLAIGKSTLTFNFSKGPGSNIEITVEADKASALITEYDFSKNSIDTSTITFGGTGTMTAAYDSANGVLRMIKTNTNNSTVSFEIPFNLGTRNLNSFTKVIIELRGVTGDYTYKDLQVVSGATQIGSVASSLGTAFKTLTINLTGIPSVTGNTKLGFRLNNTAGYTIEIKSIKLE